jgi:hypothetical protein
MPTECREYIAVPSVGDAERCEQDHLMLAFALRTRFQDGRIRGFAVRVIHGPDSIIDEDLDEDEVVAITGGTFPAVWCNVTYDPDSIHESDWSGLVSTFGLRVYATAYDEYPKRHAEPGAAPDRRGMSAFWDS